MPEKNWTITQMNRFRELGLDPDEIPATDSLDKDLNRAFQTIEKQRVRDLRKEMAHLLTQTRKTRFRLLCDNLEQALFQNGFTSVTTPLIISGHALEKMGVGTDHPLSKQVFWINTRQCLRPMLAPNLYSLMQDFSRLGQRPVRFFEIGSCFRKESSGALHSNEFTMLNLVEMGLPSGDRHQRLEDLAGTVMEAAGITDYAFETEDSEVYGTTVDVVAGPKGVEVASGAMGPHALDNAWGITDTWVGMGFGLERLIMVSQADNTIGRWSKGLSWLDGIPLKI